MSLRRHGPIIGLPVILVLAISLALPLQSSTQNYEVRQHYTKHEHMVPMRDGVRLFTSVYVPKDNSRAHPFLMERTPYSVAPYGVDNYKKVLGPHEGFAEDGYIFVYQDVRGRYMSEGEFVHVRPHIPTKSGPKEIDENSDTHDTIEWLIKNVRHNNGRLGIYGISYPGFYTAAGIIDSHPAIKAASPQAPIGDWFVGDDFHHHGAFFLQDAFNFFWYAGRRRPAPTTDSPGKFPYKTQDGYQFFLDTGPLSQLDQKHFNGEIVFWNELAAHGTYDEFWQKRNIVPHMKNVRTAVMTVAGLFDAEDPYGPIRIYQSIERQNKSIPNTLVLGPWIHGGWVRTLGKTLGNVDFAMETGNQYEETIDLPFFKFYLKDEGQMTLPEARVFVTGANVWRSFQSWPPDSARERSLYLHPDASLAFDIPKEPNSADSYVSDPGKPVPYTQEIRIDRNVEYMVEDQRFAARRPDVLVYQTPELTDEVTVTGPLVADLFVSTTGTDADFVVKLIDVFPDNYAGTEQGDAGSQTTPYMKVPMGGYQMLVRGEVMRAKFRKSYEKPEPLVPGEVTQVRFQMPDVAHTFKRGHRVMIQVQSSWFPLVDRNPQTFVDIYSAKETDFQVATQKIHRSPEAASRVILRVLE